MKGTEKFGKNRKMLTRLKMQERNRQAAPLHKFACDNSNLQRGLSQKLLSSLIRFKFQQTTPPLKQRTASHSPTPLKKSIKHVIKSCDLNHHSKSSHRASPLRHSQNFQFKNFTKPIILDNIVYVHGIGDLTPTTHTLGSTSYLDSPLPVLCHTVFSIE
jgi:hypothetical protein